MTAGDVHASMFRPARVRDVAASLDVDAVHLWWLPYRRARGRAPLKALLAAYLDVPVEAVTVVEDAHGRPRLDAPHALDFNWSHSGEHALVAVARGLPALGVDIERRRARPRALALAERFFAPSEYVMLESLPAGARDDAFMRLWTAKEAVLKAHGRGLAYGLARVRFSLDDAGARPLAFFGDVGEPRQWHFDGLEIAPGLLGAVAWRGAERSLHRFRIRDDP